MFLQNDVFVSSILFLKFPVSQKSIQFYFLGELFARNLHLSHLFCNVIMFSSFIHGVGGLVNFVLLSEASWSMQSKVNLFSTNQGFL